MLSLLSKFSYKKTAAEKTKALSIQIILSKHILTQPGKECRVTTTCSSSAGGHPEKTASSRARTAVRVGEAGSIKNEPNWKAQPGSYNYFGSSNKNQQHIEIPLVNLIHPKQSK